MSGTVSIYKHPKSNKIYLDITLNGKRKRQSTQLEKTTSNLKLVEKEILPKIQIAIANGTFSFENENKISSNIFGVFAKSYFEVLKDNIRDATYQGNLVHYNNHITSDPCYEVVFLCSIIYFHKFPPFYYKDKFSRLFKYLSL